MSNRRATDRTALVIGGSIGGLLTAHFLLKAGWDVNVFESAEHLQGRGAGIVTHAAFHQAIKDLEITPAQEPGINIHTRKSYAQDGTELGSLDWTQSVTSWGRLHHVLLTAFPDERYHANHHLLSVQSSVSQASCHFSNGTTRSADLIVAADGIRSTIRQQLEPESLPSYAGYVAWRGLIPEKLFDTPELQRIFPYFSFCILPGEQVLTYPVTGEDFTTGLEERRCNAVWYRPAGLTTELQNLFTDINGQNNGISIAPNKIRPSVISDMQKDSNYLSPQHAAIFNKITEPFIQPIYDVESESMVHRRIALVGDAAYTARPHLGMGVTKVAEDARCLVESLNKAVTIDHGLAEFKQAMQANPQLRSV